MYYFIKRTLDIVIAATALIVLSPILLLAALAIRIESKGPIVYRSKRVGQHYKIFDMIKFRSMYVDADKKMDLMKALNSYDKNKQPNEAPEECPICKTLGRTCSPLLYNDNKTICENFFFIQRDGKSASSFIKIQNDPRITKVGSFLRNTSIDELPQLINILKGDMSVVGNRPLPMYEAEKLTSDIAINRFCGPAGLTGLWQVTKRGKGEMSELERIELDVAYSETCSLKTDLRIMLKTVPALFQKENV